MQTDEQILTWIRNNSQTAYHPIGTCRMGPAGPTTVVDDKLKVHGLEGLRVADASIFPTMPSGNTNAPSIMVGEKAAELDMRTGELTPGANRGDSAGMALPARPPGRMSLGTLLLGSGPRFARDALGPMLAFYALWKLWGLLPGVAAATLVAVSAFWWQRRQSNSGIMPAIGLGIALIQALVGLASGSA